MVTLAGILCATFQIAMPCSNSRSLTRKDDFGLTLSLTYWSALPSQHHDSFMNAASLGIAQYNTSGQPGSHENRRLRALCSAAHELEGDVPSQAAVRQSDPQHRQVLQLATARKTAGVDRLEA